MDRRRESRLFAEVPGSYQHGRDAEDIMFGAISPNGCRLNRVDRDLRVGEIIALNLGPIGPIEATVRWNQDGCAGVEFHEPLEPCIVDYFAAFCGAAAAA